MTTSIPENNSSPFLFEWLKKEEQLPESQRKLFRTEITKIFCSVSQLVGQMPQRIGNATQLSLNSATSLSAMQESAQRLFNQCLNSQTQHTASIERHEDRAQRIGKASINIAAFPQLPEQAFFKEREELIGLMESTAAVKTPSQWVVADVKQSMQIARGVAGTMEAAQNAASTVIQAAGKSVAVATDHVCSCNSITQSACTNIANTAQTFTQPIAQTGKAVLAKTQIIPFLRDFRNSLHESREKEAQSLASTYGLSLASTRQYMHDMETIFTGCLFVGSLSKTIKKTPTASTAAQTITPAVQPKSILPRHQLLTPGAAADTAAQQIVDPDFHTYRQMVAKRTKPVNLPKSKGEVAWTKTLDGGIYKVEVDLLLGKVNVFEMIDHLKTEAISKGANTLRVEAIIVNEKLHKVLKERYNFSGEFEAHGYLEIPLIKK